MRWLNTRLLAPVLLVAGCSAGELSVVDVPQVGTPVPTLAVDPTPVEPEVATTSPEPPEPVTDDGVVATTEVMEPGGLITPTGIPVALLTEVTGGYLVRNPCGRPAMVSGGRLLRAIDVVLDPGHGGPIDTGAVGPNGLVERDLNLDLALATETELRVRGVSVVMTRTADYHTTLSTRAALADSLGAQIMVSIHHNAPVASPSLEPGTEVFVQKGSVQSNRLGGLLWEAVSSALGTVEGVQWTRAADAGVFTVLNTEGNDAYGMIRRPETTTALIELGYIANRSEAEFMATDAYLSIAAIALADGIEAYLNTDDPGAGYGDGRIFNPDAAPGEDVCLDPDLD